MAFGVLNAVKAAGLNVPQDVWVIGYDDVRESRWPVFDLRTVQQDSRAMARIGAQRLLSRIDNPDADPYRQVLPVELQVRGSTQHAPFVQG